MLWKNYDMQIYMATNLVNGTRYIGMTKHADVRKRVRAHKNNAAYEANKSPIARAVKQYGIDMFRFTTLKTVTSHEEMCDEERRLIAVLKPEYNVAKGGEGVVPTDGFRHKLRLRALSDVGKRQFRAVQLSAHAAVRKRVVCLDDSMTFESVKDAADHYAVHACAISQMCRGIPYKPKGKTPYLPKSVGGFRFSFAEEA